MNVYRRFSILMIIVSLSALFLFSCSTRPSSVQPRGLSLLEFTDERNTGAAAQASGPIDAARVPVRESSGERKGERFSGEQVFSALKKAYPGKIEELAFRGSDWAVRIGDRWFYWAHGRLLPEELRDRWEEYAPYPFYSYSHELPPPPDLTESEAAALKKRLRERELHPVSRYPGLYNALWGIHDKSSGWEKVKTTYFLGMKTEIHRELLEDLAAVEEDILSIASKNGEVKRFVDSLAQLEGYNWRRISGTATLSFHSYGIALDILPVSYRGKQAYWRWAMPFYPDWYSLPYEKRFMPPKAFIEAFEKHGFVWGGKWLYFDTIHFEYRPEILILNGF